MSFREVLGDFKAFLRASEGFSGALVSFTDFQVSFTGVLEALKPKQCLSGWFKRFQMDFNELPFDRFSFQLQKSVWLFQSHIVGPIVDQLVTYLGNT